MPFTIREELFVFLYALITGASLFLFYDFLRACTQKGNCSLFVLNVTDGIFVTVACITVLFVTLTVSRGIVRFFEFFGMFLGAVFYKLLLSRLFSAFFTAVTDGIFIFFKIFFKILLTPIEFMYKIVIKCINGVLCPMIHVVRKLSRMVSLPVNRLFHAARTANRKT